MSTVYTNSTQDRFYQFPEGSAIADGELLLRNLRGDKRSVDEGAAAEFEVDEATAKALVKDEVRAFTKNAATAFSTLGEVLRAASEKSVPRPSAEQTPPAEVLANALGVTPEQLRNDPAAVKLGFSSVLQGLAKAVQQATSDAPVNRERTEARVRTVAHAFGAQTPDTNVVRESMDKLSASLNDPTLSAKIRDVSARVEEAAAKLKAEGERILGEMDSDGQDAS
ncbi:MAG: hypothetical protein ACJAZO_001619 [Myxococcota bacterium]|jgi:hypothetical protein